MTDDEVDLDDFPGADDAEKMRAALKWIGAQASPPALRLPGRHLTGDVNEEIRRAIKDAGGSPPLPDSDE